MKKLVLFLCAALLLVIACAVVWQLRSRKSSPPPASPEAAVALPEPCRDVTFEGTPHIVCVLSANRYDVRILHEDPSGKPFGTVAAADSSMMAQGRPPVLSMNAGMYHKDLSPVGLLVEEGQGKAALNLDDAEGNFFMKPNGVFMIDRSGQGVVIESQAYQREKPEALYATQSGPMLVIDGNIHPRFEPDGASRYIRNGVGVDGQNRMVLAISRKPVSLGSFARLFRDELDCSNALFLDGAISTLTAGGQTVIGGKHPAGPILSVFARK